MFNGNNLSHKVLLTAEQASKLGNVIKSNISSDKSCVEFRISKIVLSGKFSGSLLSKLAGPINESSSKISKKTILALLRVKAD